ncbi:Concanavalin A-like lectin/glucanase domain,Legume-like lectin [Cinara cedri]|uniref:Concanavalin A-like lectin/glucanase domain,Legume-like lectin n=1 Tax=Cinara cedri TaxID=506608 RepID=A0A5E4MXA6_9HEMI|nr:Concanavalin A-like lectin/glucanase domain,Legume-like lectin [Cinara cedri]
MKSFCSSLFFIVLLSGYANNGQCNQIVSRFEYKYSFKPPYLAQKDGSVPFWEYGGNAIASSDNVRIAPSLKSQKGAIWTKSQTKFDWWTVEINFRVSGRGRIGADGLAFWYTDSQGHYDGPVFGSSDKWVGLGIFFDSFDNDAKHNNPYIFGIVNDGSKIFDHANDGSTQQLSGCLRDFRNKPFATRAKIEYYMNTLTVYFHSGNTNNEKDFEICFRSENVFLPKSGYFGVSAATGGLADDHDIHHFLTHSLFPPGTTFKSSAGTSVDEEQKLTNEYANYQRKLKQETEDYQKQHPESKTKEDSEFEDWYETDNQRELHQIFSGQSQIVESVKILNQKLDEIVGRQERTLGLLSNVQSTMAVLSSVGGHQPNVQTPQMAQLNAGIGRQDIESLIVAQNSIISSVREVKNYVVEVHSKSDTIIKNQVHQPTAQVQPLGYDQISIMHEIRDSLNAMKRDSASRPSYAQPIVCPSCATSTVVIVTAVVQMFLFTIYVIYKNNKESQAKKFY